jgi:hypothetical protein
VSGWDMGFDEAEMFQCVNHHTACQEHTDEEFEDGRHKYSEREARKYIAEKHPKLTSEEDIQEYLEDYKGDWYSEYLYQVPTEACPLCSFRSVTDIDELEYYRKNLQTSKSKTVAELRDKFKTYDKFKKFLQSKTCIKIEQ